MAADDRYTKLLIHGDGEDGSKKIFDECGHGAPVVNRNDVYMRTNVSPVFGNGMCCFSGNKYLRTTTFIFGTGDFTIEAFINVRFMPTSDFWPANWNILMSIAGVGTPSTADGCNLVLGKTELILQSNNTTIISGVHNILPKNWYHVAATRSGNVFRLFVNGTKIAEVTNSDIMGTGAYTYIGCETGEGAYFNGFMDEVRISNSARWTDNFNVTTEEYEKDDNTLLLLHMNGTKGSSDSFIDEASNPVSSYGGCYIFSSLNAKFGNSFACFDGLQNNLLVSNNNTVLMGSSAFTIDFNFLITVGNKVNIILSMGGSNTGFLIATDENNRIKVYAGFNAIVSSDSISLYEWHHCALVGNGGSSGSRNMKLYLDGNLVGTWLTDYYYSNNLVIGANGDGVYECFTGLMDEFRYSVGVQRWTENFQVPTVAYDTDDYTVLLLHMEDMDNTGVFIDSSAKLSIFGNTCIKQYKDIDTPVAKFGNGCIHFGGSSDYILLPNSKDLNFGSEYFNFGSGDFTIDFWFNPSSASRSLIFGGSSDYIFYIDYNYRGTRNINVWASSNGGSWSLMSADPGGKGLGSISLNLNDWNHVAVTRNGDIWRTFINGVKDIEVTSSGALVYNETDIKRLGNPNDYPINGYIDEFRISNVARWTDSFDVPISPYTSKSLMRFFATII